MSPSIEAPPAKLTPLLMKGPLVCKTLKREKTLTCRPIDPWPVATSFDAKKRPTGWSYKAWNTYRNRGLLEERLLKDCPYGGRGDRIWIRETLRCDNEGFWFYDADHYPVPCPNGKRAETVVWADRWQKKGVCPSIHMPKWACRIYASIVSIRAMPVTELDAQDFIDEGLSSRLDEQAACDELRDQFQALWDGIYPDRPFIPTTWIYAIAYTLDEIRRR